MRNETEGIYHFPQVGVMITKSPGVWWIISPKRAGANRFFLDKKNNFSDCGFIGELANGKNVAAHDADSFYFDKESSRLFIRGCFSFEEQGSRSPKRVPVAYERIFSLKRPYQIVNSIWMGDAKLRFKELFLQSDNAVLPISFLNEVLQCQCVVFPETTDRNFLVRVESAIQ